MYHLSPSLPNLFFPFPYKNILFEPFFGLKMPIDALLHEYHPERSARVPLIKKNIFVPDPKRNCFCACSVTQARWLHLDTLK